jgi:molybdate transport system substrate-binding protein
MKRRQWLGFVLAGTMAPMAARAEPNGLVVFAAASLKNALDEIAAGWTAATGKPAPHISYAASSTLARQIEQGAPADLFISADLDWMDYVDKKDLIKKESRVNLLGNEIVVVAPRDSKVSLELKPGVDIARALNGGRLAMGNVDAVPCGMYGKAALIKLGAWDGVKDRIAQAENVRVVLLLVARGEAPLGIVYATDAAPEPNVRIVAAFPADSHPPIVYPAAITRDSKSTDATGFLDYLKGMKARTAFEKQGFKVLVKATSAT